MWRRKMEGMRERKEKRIKKKVKRRVEKKEGIQKKSSGKYSRINITFTLTYWSLQTYGG
jgi:hypothetical protein